MGVVRVAGTVTCSSRVRHVFVTCSSRSCHVLFTFFSRSFHVLVTFLSRSCHVLVTFLPRSCHVIVTFLPPSCQLLATFLSRFCHVRLFVRSFVCFLSVRFCVNGRVTPCHVVDVDVQTVPAVFDSPDSRSSTHLVDLFYYKSALRFNRFKVYTWWVIRFGHWCVRGGEAHNL